MSKYTYSPKKVDECKPVYVPDEARYPSMHMDIGPEQLKGLKVDEDVEIVIRGKLKSFRYDSEDDWGTGASISISLRSCEIKSKEAESVIDELLGDDV